MFWGRGLVNGLVVSTVLFSLVLLRLAVGVLKPARFQSRPAKYLTTYAKDCANNGANNVANNSVKHGAKDCANHGAINGAKACYYTKAMALRC